jgi:hypothetical protein
MAYYTSTKAQLGSGLRKVLNISPQVTSVIPGFTYIDHKILAALSHGVKTYRQTDLDKMDQDRLCEVMKDGGIDFSKILKICGKRPQTGGDSSSSSATATADEAPDSASSSSSAKATADEAPNSASSSSSAKATADEAPDSASSSSSAKATADEAPDSASSSSSAKATADGVKPLTGMEMFERSHKMCKSMLTDGVGVV